jgi:hypothetical protein
MQTTLQHFTKLRYIQTRQTEPIVLPCNYFIFVNVSILVVHRRQLPTRLHSNLPDQQAGHSIHTKRRITFCTKLTSVQYSLLGVARNLLHCFASQKNICNQRINHIL